MKFQMISWNVQLSPVKGIIQVYIPSRMVIAILNGYRCRSRHVWEQSQCLLLGLGASVKLLCKLKQVVVHHLLQLL